MVAIPVVAVAQLAAGAVGLRRSSLASCMAADPLWQAACVVRQ